MNQAVAAPGGIDLVSALADCHAQPLWDRYHRITRRAPTAPDAPWHWPWDRMAPLIDRAVAEVSMQDAERRVLLLTHPAFPGSVGTTTNLSSGLQTLLPGETARAHRHALQAIRFVMQGKGAVTSVNEHRCAMAEGDLILTPAWTWHEHIHPGEGRMVWFDGLDLPLCTYLDTMFFEMGGEDRVSVEPLPTRSPSLRADAAALGPDAADGPTDQGGRYRFAWERACSLLAQTAT
ncbi:MAG: cupin domain-containing protein, partial [Burkholderiaceae bacterium]